MSKLYDKICKLEVYIAAFCFTTSCLIIFSAAVFRSLGRPLNWSMDMSLFLFAWSVFLSADAALRAGKLVRVEVLFNFMKPSLQKWVMVGNYLIIFVFLIALIVYGVRLSFITRARSFQGIPGFSYTWVTLSIPVGATLQVLTVVTKVKEFLKSKPS
ncbi:MAG: TRAP transporter small permease subunit [Spirochaetes bacterium]|nr:TRAP transporter small permease subunit [Spirochaetota bacterium]